MPAPVFMETVALSANDQTSDLDGAAIALAVAAPDSHIDLVEVATFAGSVDVRLSSVGGAVGSWQTYPNGASCSIPCQVRSVELRRTDAGTPSTANVVVYA